MNTNVRPEPTIVIRARYLGNDPTMSEPESRFFLGELPIIEKLTKLSDLPKSETSKLKFRRSTGYFYYVEFLRGDIVIDQTEGRVGVKPGTQLVLYEVPLSVAETFKTVPNWNFIKLSWSKYRELIGAEYRATIRRKDELVEKLTSQWTRFFNLAFDKPSPKIIRFDARIGKKQRDPMISDSERFHYHVTVNAIKPADLFNAVEYFEQAFFLLGVECTVTVDFDTTEVYQTPLGLTHEPTEEE